MIKVVYASLVFLLSSALVFITKGGAHDEQCTLEVTGVVSTNGDPKSTDFIITTPDNQCYRPRLANEDVVLALGQRVKACATVVGKDADGTPVLAIHQVAVLP